MSLLLNCDLGESFGAWSMGMDEAVMPYIDLANIACGFHAGDPLVIQNTLRLAKRHGVRIGAHPSYPDLMGFGRRSIHASAQEIHALIHYQVSALDGMAASAGLTLEYVKPHGALYNDMMAKATVRHAIMQAVSDFHRPLPLLLQATPDARHHREEAAKFGIELWFEVYADRCYDDDGSLLPRQQPDAIHDRAKMLEQARQLATEHSVTTRNGHRLALQADTICVHGDNPEAIDSVRTIREFLKA